VSQIWLSELYYRNCEKLGRETVRIRYLFLRRSGLTVLALNETLSRLAGELKCKHGGKLSFVDACVLAVATEAQSTLITSDPRISGMALVPTRLIERT